MARIRNIKPEFFQSEEIAALPMEARLAFIGLWTQADCNGRLADRPMRLKVAIFPYDPKVDMEKVLSALADGGLITRYENGGKYIEINTFRKHQAISNRERDIGSDIPAPSKEQPEQVPGLDRASTGTGSVQDRSDDIGHRTKDIGHRTKDDDNGRKRGSRAPKQTGAGAPVVAAVVHPESGHPEAVHPDAVLKAWNATARARGWPTCSRTPGGATGELLAERCRDPYFATHYEHAIQRLAAFKWPEKPIRLSVILKPDNVRAIIDGEWDDKTSATGVYTRNELCGF